MHQLCPAHISWPKQAEDDYYKMLLEDCAKDCVYFDKKVDFTLQLVKETNEEMLDDSDDNEYGEYNGFI